MSESALSIVTQQLYETQKKLDDTTARLYRRDGHQRMQIFDETLPPDPKPDSTHIPEDYLRIAGAWLAAQLGEDPEDTWRGRAQEVRFNMLLDTASYLATQIATRNIDKKLMDSAQRLYKEQIPGSPEHAAKEEREQRQRAESAKLFEPLFKFAEASREDAIKNAIEAGEADDAVIRRFNRLTLDKAIEAGAEAEANEAFKDAPFKPDTSA